MRLFKRPSMAAVILAFAVAAVGGIGGVLYFGVFSPHSQVALDSFNSVYGTAGTRLDTCKTCHSTGRSTNSYGSHQKSEFASMITSRAENLTEERSLDAFRAVLRGIEELDSDNDGYSNMEEIRARTFPGDPGDHPLTVK